LKLFLSVFAAILPQLIGHARIANESAQGISQRTGIAGWYHNARFGLLD
jgi:hypothetical protein